jgi:ribosomal protein L11
MAKIKGGSAEPNRIKVASLTWDQVRTIAQDKMVDLNCFTVESAMKWLLVQLEVWVSLLKENSLDK